MAEEDRYETIEIVVKTREDGQSWFDIIFDLITDVCEGDPDVEGSCTCGLESMGGSSGTLEQCYEHMRISENWASVKTADLKAVLTEVSNYLDIDYLRIKNAYERLHKEAYWHDEFNEWLANLPDEDDEEPEQSW